MARTARELPAPPQDRLDAVKAAVRRDRDLSLQIAAAEEEIKRQKADLYKLEHEELPDLFAAAGMRSYALEAEGNMPAYAASAKPYYYANIAADWSDEKRADAFNWIARGDAPGPDGGASPDLIKTQIVVTLGRGDRKTAERVIAGLRKARVPFEEKLSVPWNTLTAFVRELVEGRKVMPPLDKLGAVVGRVVTVKPEKS